MTDEHSSSENPLPENDQEQGLIEKDSSQLTETKTKAEAGANAENGAEAETETRNKALTQAEAEAAAQTETKDVGLAQDKRKPEIDKDVFSSRDNRDSSSASSRSDYDWRKSGHTLNIRPISKVEVDVAEDVVISDDSPEESELLRFIHSTASVYKQRRAHAFLVRDFNQSASIAMVEKLGQNIYQIIDQDRNLEDQISQPLDQNIDIEGLVDVIRKSIKSEKYRPSDDHVDCFFVAIKIDKPESAWLRSDVLSQLERFCKGHNFRIALFLQIPKTAILSHFVSTPRGKVRNVLVFPWAELKLDALSNILMNLNGDPIERINRSAFLEAARWWNNARLEAALFSRVKDIQARPRSEKLEAIQVLFDQLLVKNLVNTESVGAKPLIERKEKLTIWLGLSAPQTLNQDDIINKHNSGPHNYDLSLIAALLSLSLLSTSLEKKSITHKKLSILVEFFLPDTEIPKQFHTLDEKIYLKNQYRLAKKRRKDKANLDETITWRMRYNRAADKIWHHLNIKHSADSVVSLPKEWSSEDLTQELYQLAPGIIGRMLTDFLDVISNWMVEAQLSDDVLYSHFQWHELIDLIANIAIIMGPNFETQLLLDQLFKYSDKLWNKINPTLSDPDFKAERLGQVSTSSNLERSKEHQRFIGQCFAEILSSLMDSQQRLLVSKSTIDTEHLNFKRAILSKINAFRTRAVTLALLYSFHEYIDGREQDLEALLDPPKFTEGDEALANEITGIILEVVQSHILYWQDRRFHGETVMSWKHWVSGLYNLCNQPSKQNLPINPKRLLTYILYLYIQIDVHPGQSRGHRLSTETVHRSVESATIEVGSQKAFQIHISEMREVTLKFHYRSYSDMPPPASSTLIFEDSDSGDTIRAVADQFFNVSPAEWQAKQTYIFTDSANAFEQHLQDLKTIILGGCSLSHFGNSREEQYKTISLLDERTFRSIVASFGLSQLTQGADCSVSEISRKFTELHQKRLNQDERIQYQSLHETRRNESEELIYQNLCARRRSHSEELEYQALFEVYGLFWSAILLHWRCREFGVGSLRKGSDAHRRLSRFLELTAETCKPERLQTLRDGLILLEHILHHEVAFALDDPQARAFYEQKASAAQKLAKFFKLYVDGT